MVPSVNIILPVIYLVGESIIILVSGCEQVLWLIKLVTLLKLPALLDKNNGR